MRLLVLGKFDEEKPLVTKNMKLAMLGGVMLFLFMVVLRSSGGDIENELQKCDELEHLFIIDFDSTNLVERYPLLMLEMFDYFEKYCEDESNDTGGLFK